MSTAELKRSPPSKPRQTQRLFLDSVTWREYERFLELFQDHPGIRLTYDRGRLEIMTLSFEHEGCGYLLGRFVDVLTEELHLACRAGRSTTFRKRSKNRGLEPDNCYWVQNADRIRGKRQIDLKEDPPPDLALEVDITHSSLNRMRIYAALGVPEVWRHDGTTLGFFGLGADGKYQPISESRIFACLAPADVARFLAAWPQGDDNEVVRAFRQWVREHLAQQRPTPQ